MTNAGMDSVFIFEPPQPTAPETIVSTVPLLEPVVPAVPLLDLIAPTGHHG